MSIWLVRESETWAGKICGVQTPLSANQALYIDGETSSIYSFIFIKKLFAGDYFRHKRYISEQNQILATVEFIFPGEMNKHNC